MNQTRNQTSELKIVIVGGVAGGMSAATRARRVNEHASIIVLERSGYISFANCGLPYYLSGKIKNQADLFLTTPARVGSRFRIDARVHHEVTRVDRTRRCVEGINRLTQESFVVPYDKLILAPGAKPLLPPLENLEAGNVFVLRNIEDTLRLDAFLRERQPKRAVVVGAGFIGLEMVEALCDRGLEVTLIEKAPHVLPALDAQMAGWLERELRTHGVRLELGTGVTELLGNREGVHGVRTEAGALLETDLVLLSIGVRPTVELAERSGLALGRSGGIQVDRALRTSDPDVYAVGDATEVTQGVSHFATRVPLAGAANRQGRIAGEHAASGQAPPSPQVLGTAIVRVFGLEVGVTGLGRAAAAQAGYSVGTALVHPKHHAGYYPGAQQMHFELVYDEATGKVLGAQAAGGAGVDKRLDVIATLLHFGGTLEDLAALDLAYAPQFSSAKDPVHMAAFVAQNDRQRLCPSTDEVPRGVQLLDVRTRPEFERGALPNAVNIPLDELRERLGELDPHEPVVVYCEVGIRGYAATRILLQRGFRHVQNLKGGYLQQSRTAS
ncbi:MAG TPA: FAD-dependent oxidoreductase [Polyangiaceae bacterium]|nr:FAD-dependent oxidoreductase [Polyangiaceae bacterium]